METLIQHQITLRFLEPEGHQISCHDEIQLLQRCSKIPGWTVKDPYGYDAELFEIYQPEYDEAVPQDGVLKGSTIWTITFGATSNISLFDPSADGAIQVPAVLIVHHIRELVAEFFPSLQYLRSTEYRKFEYSRTASLAF